MNGRYGACQIDVNLIDADIYVVVNCLGLASGGIGAELVEMEAE